MTSYMTKEKFDADIANHQLTVLHDHDLLRHVRCSNGTYLHWFEIITWKGRLCITGDMGTFVFARLDDMFEFFRNKEGKINRSYWAEKVESVDRHGSLRHWSSDLWREAVKKDLDEYIHHNAGRIGEQEEKELREAVADELIDDEHDAVQSAHDFEYDGKQIFFDMYEHDCQTWSPRFVWCLYAITWAIQQYDARKAT